MNWKLCVVAGGIVALAPAMTGWAAQNRGDQPVVGSLPNHGRLNAGGGSNGIDGVIMVGPNDRIGEVGGEADIYSSGPVVRKLGTIRFRAYIGTVGDAAAKAAAIASAINNERGSDLKELVTADSVNGVVTLSGNKNTNVGAVSWTKGDDTTCESTKWIDDRDASPQSWEPLGRGVTFTISGQFSGVRANGKPSRLRLGTGPEATSVAITAGDTANTVLRRMHAALAEDGQLSTLTLQGGIATAITLPYSDQVTAGLWDTTGFLVEWEK